MFAVQKVQEILESARNLICFLSLVEKNRFFRKKERKKQTNVKINKKFEKLNKKSIAYTTTTLPTSKPVQVNFMKSLTFILPYL